MLIGPKKYSLKQIYNQLYSKFDHKGARDSQYIIKQSRCHVPSLSYWQVVLLKIDPDNVTLG